MGARFLQRLCRGSLSLPGGSWVLQGDRRPRAGPALPCPGAVCSRVTCAPWPVVSRDGEVDSQPAPPSIAPVLVAAGAAQCRLCSHSPVHPRPWPCFIYLCLSRSVIQIKHGHKNVRESSNLFITHFAPIKISIKAAWF